MNDSSAFIDPDLSTPPPGKGKGLIEMPESELELFASSMPTFAEARPGAMVPESEWKPRALERMANKQRRDDVVQIYDQGQFGSCTGFAAAQVCETLRRRRYGRKHWVSLSGLSLYMQIPGVTQSSGATIPAAMDRLCKVGPLPTNTPENTAKFTHTHPLRTWQQLPIGFQETAKNFRGHRFAVARGIDEIFSAMINDYCGFVGRQGHAVPYVDAAWSTRYNEPLVPFPNSYSPEWGDEGFGYDSRRIVRDIVCYVLLDVVIPPDVHIPDLDLVTSA